MGGADDARVEDLSLRFDQSGNHTCQKVKQQIDEYQISAKTVHVFVLLQHQIRPLSVSQFLVCACVSFLCVCTRIGGEVGA